MTESRKLLFGKWPVGDVVLTNPADRVFRSVHPIPVTFPVKTAKESIDHRNYCPPHEDQGSNPWCLIHAMKQILETLKWRREHVLVDNIAVPADWYAESKRLDGDPKGDGTTMSAGWQAGRNLGVIAPESKFRDIRTFEEYQLAVEDHLVVISCFAVTDRGWNAGPEGWIHPQGPIVGYHAVTGVGYSVLEDWAGFQNQWTGFGAKGFGRMRIHQWKQYYSGGFAIDMTAVPAPVMGGVA